MCRHNSKAMAPSKSLRRKRRKTRAVASLLPAGETDALQRVKRHLQQIFAAAGQATALVHSDDFWEKVRKYTSKILESMRAPVCNLLKVPITFVDAAREIVRFMCQQIAACARPSQTHLVGTCGEASSYIKEVLDDAAATLAETLSWLTSKKFWSAFREFTDATGKLPENCAPLARTTVRQRAADAAKTFLALPNEKRQAYLGGLKVLGQGLLNYARGKTHTTELFEEVCLKSTLDAIKTLTELSPNSWLSKDLIYVLSKTLSKLWKHPMLFSS